MGNQLCYSKTIWIFAAKTIYFDCAIGVVGLFAHNFYETRLKRQHSSETDEISCGFGV